MSISFLFPVPTKIRLSLSRARDYCTSSAHVVRMCLNVIKVSVYLQNWAHVQSYIAKAFNTPDFSESKQLGQALSIKRGSQTGAEVGLGVAYLASRPL